MNLPHQAVPEDIQRIVTEFEMENFQTPIKGLGVSKVCLHDKNVSKEEGDNWCLVLEVSDEESRLQLPPSYQGLRVFIEVRK